MYVIVSIIAYIRMWLYIFKFVYFALLCMCVFCVYMGFVCLSFFFVFVFFCLFLCLLVF